MCYPKPGPRCSAHAGKTLAVASARAEEAERVWEHALAENKDVRRLPLPEQERRQQAVRDARKMVDETRLAHSVALREFETTPEGLTSLKEAATRLETATDVDSVHARETILQRVQEAQDTRDQQMVDYKLAQEYKHHLDHPTPEEAAAVYAADLAAENAAQTLADSETAWRDAAAALQARRAESHLYLTQEQNGHMALDAAKQETQQAAAAVMVEAQRLYVEAGVAPRMAALYANDMAETAAVPRQSQQGYQQRPVSGSDGLPKRPLVVKVKRAGADRDKTLDAKTASETDVAFQAANQRLVETLAHARTVAASGRNSRVSVAPAQTEIQGLQQSESRARFAMQDARQAFEVEQTNVYDLRARIGSGIGVASTETVTMAQASGYAMRNPDGSTNTYVYRDPSPGFDYGRYLQATGVRPVSRGFGPSNEFVLANGTTASFHERHYRSTRGAVTDAVGDRVIVVTAPLDGATFLAAEGGSGGFTSFVDSTD